MKRLKRTHFTSRPERGFTFVEILAAMLFMVIVIPVTFEAVQLANRVSTGAARRREAAQLVDRVMNEALISDSWRGGDEAGDFGDEAPGFRWEVVTGDWEEDTQRLITARVYYKVQDQEYSAELSTLAPSEEEDNSSTS